jgi:mannitol operon transcriptional antiterminator
VRHDLEHLRPWLEIHGLLLILRRGFGVTVAGEEERKREALRSLIMEQFGEAGILALIRDERIEDSCPDEPVVHLFNHFPPERFREAEAALSSLAKGILPPLAPRDYLAWCATWPSRRSGAAAAALRPAP